MVHRYDYVRKLEHIVDLVKKLRDFEHLRAEAIQNLEGSDLDKEYDKLRREEYEVDLLLTTALNDLGPVYKNPYWMISK